MQALLKTVLKAPTNVSPMMPVRASIKELIPADQSVMGQQVVFGEWIFCKTDNRKTVDQAIDVKSEVQSCLVHLDKSNPAVIPLGNIDRIESESPDFKIWGSVGNSSVNLFVQYELQQKNAEYKIVQTSAPPFRGAFFTVFSRLGNVALVTNLSDGTQVLRFTQTGVELALPATSSQGHYLDSSFKFIGENYVYVYVSERDAYEFFSFDGSGFKRQGEVRFPKVWGDCEELSCSPDGKNWYFLSSREELFIFTINRNFEIKVTCSVRYAHSAQWNGNGLLVRAVQENDPFVLPVDFGVPKYNVLFFPDPSKNESLLILTSGQASLEGVNEDCINLSSSISGDVAICGKENVISFPLSTLLPEHKKRKFELLTMLHTRAAVGKEFPKPIVDLTSEYAQETVESDNPWVVTKACLAFQFKSFLEDQSDESQIARTPSLGDQKLFSSSNKKIAKDVEGVFILTLKDTLNGAANYRQALDDAIKQFQQYDLSKKTLSSQALQIVENIEFLADKQQKQLQPVDAKRLGH